METPHPSLKPDMFSVLQDVRYAIRNLRRDRVLRRRHTAGQEGVADHAVQRGPAPVRSMTPNGAFPRCARTPVRTGFRPPARSDQPLHWRRPRKIFVNSMSDLFHEDVPPDYIGRVGDVMRRADWHVFPVLTKGRAIPKTAERPAAVDGRSRREFACGVRGAGRCRTNMSSSRHITLMNSSTRPAFISSPSSPAGSRTRSTRSGALSAQTIPGSGQRGDDPG